MDKSTKIKKQKRERKKDCEWKEEKERLRVERKERKNSEREGKTLFRVLELLVRFGSDHSFPSSSSFFSLHPSSSASFFSHSLFLSHSFSLALSLSLPLTRSFSLTLPISLIHLETLILARRRKFCVPEKRLPQTFLFLSFSFLSLFLSKSEKEKIFPHFEAVLLWDERRG